MRTLDDVALIAEYEWRFGGAQRLLSIMSEYWGKPIFLSKQKKSEDGLIWSSKYLEGLPSNDVYFSIVVDKYELQTFKDKLNIKFCHSLGTIENHLDNLNLNKIDFVTHRQRVFEEYKKKNINISYISDGYIPYDKIDSCIDFKKNSKGLISISRLCPDRMPLELVKKISELQVQTVLIGSSEDKEYIEKIRKKIKNQPIQIIAPDELGGVSEKLKDYYLLNSPVMLHYSKGGSRDYLEYAILDGFIFGTVPICITGDKSQFNFINQNKLGLVIDLNSDIKSAYDEIMSQRENYVRRIDAFIKTFLKNQNELKERWTDHIINLINSKQLNF